MYPLKNHSVTYPYGVKNARYAKGYHTGVDMVSADQNICAVVSGTVIESRWAGGKGADPNGWGNYVILRTTDGKYDLIHAHLSSVKVSAGQKVTQGTVLGIMGNTGQSTGPHLHFEVRKAPWQNKNDIDPIKWLDEIGVDDMLEKLVVYADGDVGAALTYSQNYGIPMIRVTEKTLEDVLKKYPAKKTYIVGISGQNTADRIYITGANRMDSAKKLFEK